LQSLEIRDQTLADSERKLASEDENKRVARIFYDGFQQGDWQKIKNLFAPNYKYHLAGVTNSNSETQEKKIAELHQGFSKFEILIHRMIAEKDNVAVVFTIEGIHSGTFAGVQATGSKIHVASVGLLRIDNGKITQYDEIIHFLRLLEQIGAVPPRSDGW
jgi:steroid delta-isomerase-like uncharacterized protein